MYTTEIDWEGISVEVGITVEKPVETDERKLMALDQKQRQAIVEFAGLEAGELHLGEAIRRGAVGWDRP